MNAMQDSAVDDFDYKCVFSHRFGTKEMRRIWSEEHKRLLWRDIWAKLAKSQAELGLISLAQAEDIEAHKGDVNLPRSLEIEEQTKHDLLSEARCFAEQCKTGGGVIHLGATSADIEDNADILRAKLALDVLLHKMNALLIAFVEKVEEMSSVPTMGFTHLQAAEPTTVGYRLAQYLYELFEDYQQLLLTAQRIKGKGMKGAVGTSASYVELFVAKELPYEAAVKRHAQMELKVMQSLGIEMAPVSTQTYSRKQDVYVANNLAAIAASVYKFCQDLRLLQSSPIAEWFEPRGRYQVGSSTMPFKRNPTTSENVNGICRIAMALPAIFLQNASHSFLERTLDDSPGRAFGLPTLFIAIDDVITKCTAIVTGLQINLPAVLENNRRYHAIAMTEKLLLVCVTKGANRQQLHEHLRTLCSELFESHLAGEARDIQALIKADELISSYVTHTDIDAIFSSQSYIGNCKERCQELTQLVRRSLA